MAYLLGIVYMILSFVFTFWIIDSTGNYWWVLLLIFLLSGFKMITTTKEED